MDANPQARVHPLEDLRCPLQAFMVKGDIRIICGNCRPGMNDADADAKGGSMC